MPLRAGFDLDGVAANFRGAFERAARHLPMEAGDPEGAEAGQFSSQAIKEVWSRIIGTSNWWASLDAYEPDQIARLYALSRARGWEVVFMTKRPLTAGDTVQFQTQQWLERHGFKYPAVVTVPGSRGELANALRLDIVVDDQLYNCIDVVTNSRAKALLLDRDGNERDDRQATSRGIGVVRSLEAAIDAMESLARSQAVRKGRLQRLGDWFTGA